MSAASEANLSRDLRSERERAEIPLRERIRAILDNPRWINLLDAHGQNLRQQVSAALDNERSQM